MTEFPSVERAPASALQGISATLALALSNKLFKSQAQVTEDIDPCDAEHIKGGAFKGPSKTHAEPSWQWNTPQIERTGLWDWQQPFNYAMNFGDLALEMLKVILTLKCDTMEKTFCIHITKQTEVIMTSVVIY